MASDNRDDDIPPAGDLPGGGNGRESPTGRHRPVVEDRMSLSTTGHFLRAARWARSWKGLLALVLTIGGGAGAWAVRAYLDRHDTVAHEPLIQRLDKLDDRAAVADRLQSRMDGKLDTILQLMPHAATRPPLALPPPALAPRPAR